MEGTEGMQEHAMALADAIEGALGGWVVSCVAARCGWDRGIEPDPAVLAEAEAAGRDAVLDVGPRVRALLMADIDRQATTPLSLVREAVRYPTAVLRRAGAPEAARSATQASLVPDDPYDLAPATFGDLGPELADLGIRWGAAKAYVHIRRHGGGRQT